MKNKLYLVLIAAFFSILASGCSRNFVAANIDMGLAPGKKPVYGVATAHFFLNDAEGGQLNDFVSEDFAKFVNEKGGSAKPLLHGESPILDTAVAAYFKELSDSGKIKETSNYGDLKVEFEKLGIDGMIILSGGSLTPSAGAILTETAGNMAIAALTGSIGIVPRTTMSVFGFGVVLKSGNPVFYNETIFAMIFKRDFADKNERLKMYDHMYNNINDKLAKAS